MGDFFRSARFKILALLLAFIVLCMFVTAYLGGRSSPLSQALGVVTAPLQKLSASISAAASSFFERTIGAQKLYEENLALKEEIRTLRSQQVEYEQYKRENEHYRQVLGLKEQNPEFEFEPAEVIGREPTDRFGGFTVDKGTLNGVAAHDPVITPDGLVGWISEVGLTYAKVTTILDVSIDVGAADTRTRDSGVVTGDILLADEGRCKLGYLPRESAVTAGDIVATSGLGSVFGVAFPRGLIIGTVTEVRTENNGIVLYAVVEPAAQIHSLQDVFILTSFPGQSSAAALPQEEASSASSETSSGEDAPDDQ
ncbi:MAG: rod shape-determining protein MreC [Provencibacterium sp.]|nr:rod shape-determining protein MreC [Provencibacterium sp.]